MQKRRLMSRPALTMMIVVTLILTASLVASGAATTKQLSTNFTLVNLSTSSNLVNIQYYKTDGSQWRPSESATLSNQGSQLIRRQYDDSQLTSGSGSVVVGGQGPMGAVVQIQARGQTPTSGAYSGSAAGTNSANVPLIAKNGSSASGAVNSQIIIQNTGTAATSVQVEFVNSSGATVYTSPATTIQSGASFTYDLTNDAGAPTGFFSAVVKAATGGQVTVVSNLFTGNNGMQTFSGFSASAQKWLVPLFTSRLGNGLSTPVTVQNLSGGTIPAGSIKLQCKADPSSGGSNFEKSNDAAVTNTASAIFNPVTDNSIPASWYGACTVDTAGFNTVAFVQMRFVGSDRAASYEAIRADGTKTKVIVPLYMKRLTNGFATAVTIQNLGASAATVSIAYQAGDGAAAGCTVNVGPFTVAAGGSLIQNHRITSGANSVPSLPENCFGSMVVTSTNGQPVEAFVQIDDLDQGSGDPFMAHNAFTAD